MIVYSLNSISEIDSDNFENLGVEIIVDDKKCLLNDTMGQALLRLNHLNLVNDEAITGWFRLQNEVDLKEAGLSGDESE